MNTAMDAFLAEHYGTKTAAAAPQEDLEKQASIELFLKVASEQKIDLKAMSDVQVDELYNRWVKAAAAQTTEPAAAEKTAEEKEEEEKKEKLEAAEKEHEEKKAASEKIAEADFMGRVMAHAYVNELRKIAADTSATAPAGEIKEARGVVGETGKFFKALGGHAIESGKGSHLGAKTRSAAQHAASFADKHKGTAATVAASTAAGGAAGAAAGHHKKASAIDELAYVRAQELAKEAGIDHEEVASKIAAAFTLNLVEESTKVASAPDVETAVGIRALELLEKVGYPVEWAQQ